MFLVGACKVTKNVAGIKFWKNQEQPDYLFVGLETLLAKYRYGPTQL